MPLPRSLRLSSVAAFGIILIYTVYVSYTHSSSARGSLIKHKFIISGEDSIILAYPNDPVPRFNFASLSKYPANNINEPSRFAFATLYCTRDPDTRGPYFEATQSIIWRILWSDFRSRYPLIVFVCPFIPERNRQILRGQGALVKEIELLGDIIPLESIKSERWIDVMSKLNLWKEVEWKRIVFLDSDAFPIMNIDDIFDLVPVQQCKREILAAEDKVIVDNSRGGENMCDYIYAGVSQTTEDNINAGVLFLTPNLDMHAKLMRAAKSTNDYEIKDMEQGVLKSQNAFAGDGPFPVTRLPPIWNAVPEYYIKYLAEGREATEGPVRVLHVKMWNRMWGELNNLTQLNDMWDLDWVKMCRYYDSDNGFVESRKTGIYKTPWERYLESHKAA